MAEIAQHILTECGIVSALLGVVILVGFPWLATQLAKERAGREADRDTGQRVSEEWREAYLRMAEAKERAVELLTMTRERQRDARRS